ncbi:uncharacterized protein LOC123519932 [Portunus trituberculatus]|uniref:uncharacterized protein LOC123519932 n=1 Tax=Portunus trituberculatus TaxID=210409 RepID=UPI001E1CE612|nr:uncharacterized protein LOC123519932 [Portunus trituberculatus]
MWCFSTHSFSIQKIAPEVTLGKVTRQVSGAGVDPRSSSRPPFPLNLVLCSLIYFHYFHIHPNLATLRRHQFYADWCPPSSQPKFAIPGELTGARKVISGDAQVRY